MSQPEYTFDQVAVSFVHKAANYTAWRYRKFNVTADEAAQEIWVWLYGDGRPKVERWLTSRPQQTTRIYRSMLDVAIGFSENEKAIQVGYRADDVHWYSPASVEGLMPLVLDPEYVQENLHIGSLITMVIDIRNAMTPDDHQFFTKNEPGDEYGERIQTLVNRLGGERPFIGRRRVMSNAQSQAIAKDQE